MTNTMETLSWFERCQMKVEQKHEQDYQDFIALLSVHEAEEASQMYEDGISVSRLQDFFNMASCDETEVFTREDESYFGAYPEEGALIISRINS